MAVGELCTEILHAQKLEQSYFTGYYVTYCLWSPQLVRGTKQTAQCQSTRPFSRVAIGKGFGYARLILMYVPSCNSFLPFFFFFFLFYNTGIPIFLYVIVDYVSA